ncbi:MAG: hypothetical protein EPN23_05130 [Verrucomicrobia bacterium]|nr:MAG: hypothetical protein EPN23_05130 [Verrucomicrobiota bacterium]
MSPTLRKANWVKQNYEKLVLVVALLLLLCSALFLVLQVKQKSGEPFDRLRQPGQFEEASKVNVTNLEQLLGSVGRPKLMEVGRGVMGDELRVSCINLKCGKPIPYNALSCPFCGAKQPEVVNPLTVSTEQDGISDVWKKKYGFDILDPNVANADPDNDGFSNLEEYRASTDPLDPKSHPDVASKLRVMGVRRHPFKLRFMGMMQMPAGTNYQINLRSGRTLFKGVGEEAEGYRVVAHESAAPDGDVLVLSKGAENIRLIKGKDLQQFEMAASLIFLLDHRQFHRVVKDGVLKIRGDEYKVVDIKPNAVTMRELQSAREIVVPPLSEVEREDVRRGGAMKVESGGPVGRESVPATVGAQP